MNRFFQSLPPVLKVVLHILQSVVCLTAITILVMSYTKFDKAVEPHIPLVALAFLIGFPLLHSVIELCYGEKKDKPSLSDMMADKLQDIALSTLNKVDSTITIKETTTIKTDDGPKS